MHADDGRARGLWVFPVAAVLLVVAILAINGFPHGTDWPYELTRITEMRVALGERQFPAFWSPDLYHGFGAPVFVYYAPLFATIASLFTTVAEVPDAAVAALCLSLVAAALIMWAAVKEMAGPLAGAIAAMAYVLHPYVLADIWIRNANAEVMALALLPGAVAGAISPRPHRRFWWTFLSLSGVILAHNLTALVAIAIVLAMALFVHRSARTLMPVLAGVLAALAVTAFFWVPALALRSFGVRDDALLAGKFDFHNQFPRPSALFVLDPPSDYVSGGYLGVAMLCALLIGAVIWRRGDAGARRAVHACAIAAVVLIAFMLRASTPVWETLPLMRYLQFPWRLVGPLGVVTIIGFAILAADVPLRMPRAFAVLFLAIAIVNALPVVRVYPRMERAAMRRFSALLTPEKIRDYGLRATVGDDYLPRAADPRLMRAGREPVAFLPPGMSVRVSTASAGAAHLLVSSVNGGSIAFRRWFYPVWNATVDGSSTHITRVDGGIVGLTVPPGEHEIRLDLVEPPIRTITKAASAVALACIGGVALLRRRRTHFVKTVTSADEPAGT